MLQNLAHRLGGEVGVQGHGHVAGHPDGQVGDDPVGTVLRDDGDAAARLQLQAAQPAGGATRLLADLGPGQLLDLAIAQGLGHVDLVRVERLTREERLKR
ncbi:hypothetical protein D3C78_1428480 [compost metagenome]